MADDLFLVKVAIEAVSTSMEVEKSQPVSTGEATGTDPDLMIALEKQVLY